MPVDNSVQVVEFAQGNPEPSTETQVAEEETAACGDDEKKEENAACEDGDKKEECAEQNEPKQDALAQVLAELQQEIAQMRKELAELKTRNETPAEPEAPQRIEAIAEINPFVSDITANAQRFSLLESEEKTSSYTLLDRA